MILAELEAAVDTAVPPGTTHIGFVATNNDGEVLVTTPKKPLYGVSYTFFRKRIDPGEKASRALARCIAESLGQSPLSLYPLRNTWITPNSSSYYFVGLVEWPEKPASTDAAEFHWSTPEIAARHFGSSNASSRHRDLAVLSAAMKQCASPYRRILLMLQELHRLGFERLRAPAYDYPLAWRCPIVPAAWTHKKSIGTSKKPSHHGGTFEQPPYHLHQWFGNKGSFLDCAYSSASKQQPFGWHDVAFATPRELALRFVQERPEIALSGWGPDPDYVEWFNRMLEITQPNGMITAFYADEYGTLNKDISHVLHTHFTKVEAVPLPPNGLAIPGEFDSLVQRLEKPNST